MPRHFLGLQDAATLATSQFQLAGRIIDDLVDNMATGVIHGPAGTGKTYAMEAHLERIRTDTHMVFHTLAFQGKPTMRQILNDLVRAVIGAAAPESKNRFYLTSMLTELLGTRPRLIVVDEAQRLNGDCIELLRHLHDNPETHFALLYVGGDGCWEVLSREPMLRSRVFRRLPFRPLSRTAVPELMRGYHRIYEGVDDQLLMHVDDTYAHGTLRDWAAFTQTAASLCRHSGRTHLDEEIIANAYALLGGGITDG
jgi:type II secretory pathway predicted ATPase ExeA